MATTKNKFKLKRELMMPIGKVYPEVISNDLRKRR